VLGWFVKMSRRGRARNQEGFLTILENKGGEKYLVTLVR
jgi:hypothetical protein